MTQDPNNHSFIEGEDFYFNEEGLMVLTEKYHLKRGYCCHSGCLHCPYEYAQKIDPSIPLELQLGQTEEEGPDYSKYLSDYSEEDD